jgi:hypothetical protein
MSGTLFVAPGPQDMNWGNEAGTVIGIMTGGIIFIAVYCLWNLSISFD